jgi:hypothetical protein
MKENILSFPSTNDTFPTSREEAEEHLFLVRQEYCDDVCEDVLEAVTSVLHSYGFSIKASEAHIKDIVFLEESIKALLYRYKKLKHNLHDIIDVTVNVTPEASAELEKNSKKELNNIL